MYKTLLPLVLLAIAASCSGIEDIGQYSQESTAGPEMVSPVPSSTLSGSTQTFEWTANDTPVSYWWLYVGTGPDWPEIANLHDSGSTTANSATVDNIPTDGSPIYATLFYTSTGFWESISYSYTTGSCGDTVCAASESCDACALDCGSCPAGDPNVVTRLGPSTSFLYEGPNPVQTGVAPGTIDQERASVIRGRILDETLQPLAGVTVRALEASPSQYGETLTQADGTFSYAVNGGGHIQLGFEMAGLLSAQRAAHAPVNDYVVIDDVVLIALDSAVTTVTLDGTNTAQAHHATTVVDADGTRQASIFFPANTTAELVDDQNNKTAVTMLDVRATEYTVGPEGPKRMPAPLPPASAYTYAVELSADEAIAAGAVSIELSQPVAFYVDNFLSFPIGTAVPTGYFDRQRQIWVASENGVVIGLLGVDSNGEALIDADDQPGADSIAALELLGIDQDERLQLGSMQQSGTTELWRSELSHFTPYDLNFPIGPGGDDPPFGDGGSGGGGGGGGGGSDGGDPNAPPSEPHSDPKSDEQCEDPNNSSVECNSQVLHECIDLAGTPLQLCYASDRVPGRAAAYEIHVPMTRYAEDLPPTLQFIKVDVTVAGRRFQTNHDCTAVACTASMSETIQWDGLDAFGRAVNGRVPATVKVGYSYAGTYRANPPIFGRSFGAPANENAADLGPSRERFTFWRGWKIGLGTLQPEIGWDFNVHHTLNPTMHELHFGDGRRRNIAELPPVVHTVAGPGLAPYSYGGIDVGPDGSAYFNSTSSQSIKRVDQSGVETTVATGILDPRDVAVGPDGTVYAVDKNYRRVVRVGSGGTLQDLIAPPPQGPTAGCTAIGPNALAANTTLWPRAIDIGPNGDIYVAEQGTQCYRVVRIDSEGFIYVAAGGGVGGVVVTPTPATSVHLSYLHDIAFDQQGNMYMSFTAIDFTSYIGKVDPSGNLTLIAGKANLYGNDQGDGGLALEAKLSNPQWLDVDDQGRVCALTNMTLAQGTRRAIRCIDSNGIIDIVAGTRDETCTYPDFCGEGLAAPTMHLWSSDAGIAFAPNGDLAFAYPYDNNNGGRIMRIAARLPKLPNGTIQIPSQDGREVYTFDADGRHLSTRDAVLGVTRFGFAYDTEGRLASITDRDNLVYTIVRDTSGAFMGVDAPYNRSFTATLTDASDPWPGYLESLTDPNNETYSVGYDTVGEGLVASFQRPVGPPSSYSYDAKGRINQVTDPTGQTKTWVRSIDAGGWAVVTMTTPLGRSTEYTSDMRGNGSTSFSENTSSSGLSAQSSRASDGTTTVTVPSGSQATTTLQPDPRFGLLAPLSAQTTVTPGGLTRVIERQRTTTYDINDPLNVSAWEEIMSINGKDWKTTYDAATQTWTTTSPMNRTTTRTVDSAGRTLQTAIPGEMAIDYSYDANGRLLTTTQGSRVTTRSYHPTNGRLETISDPLNQVTTYTHDNNWRRLTTTRPDTQVFAQSYDGNGNLVSVTPPTRPAHAFTYTDLDQLDTYTPPALSSGGPFVTDWSYDFDRKIDDVAYPDAVVDYQYASNGQLQHIVGQPTGQSSDTASRTYDPTTGLLSSLAMTPATGPSITMGFAYDGHLPTDITWSGAFSGSIGRVYDNDFRMVTEQVNGANDVVYTYDDDNKPTSAGPLALTWHAQHGRLDSTTAGVVQDAYTYSVLGELETYTATISGVPVYDYTIDTRDALGRITQLTETIQGQTTVYSYSYDLAGRLWQEWHNSVLVYEYTYDANGNRLSHLPGGPQVGSYDAQDRIESYDNLTFGHDDRGFVTSKTDNTRGTAVTTYSHDAHGGLLTVVLPNADTVSYRADGKGHRVQRLLNGSVTDTWLYNDDLRPAAALDGNGTVLDRYVSALGRNVPEMIVSGSTDKRLITDHLGSVRLVIDTTTGTVLDRIDYDSFGQVTSPGTPSIPFGFAGGLYDSDTRLVRFGAREYDPATGRWMAKDPTLFEGRDSNLYRYGDGDPINKVDPQGKAAQLAVAPAAASAILSAAAAAATIAGANVTAKALHCLAKRNIGYVPETSFIEFFSCEERAEKSGVPNKQICLGGFREDGTTTNPAKDLCDDCLQRCLANVDAKWWQKDFWQGLGKDPWPSDCP